MVTKRAVDDENLASMRLVLRTLLINFLLPLKKLCRKSFVTLFINVFFNHFCDYKQSNIKKIPHRRLSRIPQTFQMPN